MTGREFAKRQGHALFAVLLKRLGAEYWDGRTIDIVTMKRNGATWLKSDGLNFFADERTGEPMVCKQTGEVVEFAWITPLGEFMWGRVPEPIGSLN